MPTDSDRVVTVGICRPSADGTVAQVMPCVYMHFYTNCDRTQTGELISTVDILQAVVDKYAMTVKIMGD